jgi:hypothetical protein
VRNRAPPRIEGGEGTVALDAMTFFLVVDSLSRLFLKWLEEIEGDVGGLEVFGVGVGDVVDQRA